MFFLVNKNKKEAHIHAKPKPKVSWLRDGDFIRESDRVMAILVRRNLRHVFCARKIGEMCVCSFACRRSGRESPTSGTPASPSRWWKKVYYTCLVPSLPPQHIPEQQVETKTFAKRTHAVGGLWLCGLFGLTTVQLTYIYCTHLWVPQSFLFLSSEVLRPGFVWTFVTY